MVKKKQYDVKKGKWAEYIIALFLILKGYKFLGHRVKAMGCEIDLLMRQKNCLVAVEVKYRSNHDIGVMALGDRQLRRIGMALQVLAYGLEHQGPIRCDCLTLKPWGWPRHLVNVYQHDEIEDRSFFNQWD